MKGTSITIFISSILGLSACGVIQRHPDSGYLSSHDYDYGDEAAPYRQRRTLDNNGELAIAEKSSRAPSSIPSLQSTDSQSLIENGDIAIGMSREAVRESWGTPQVVEVSGTSKFGNERWTYREYLPSRDGYVSQDRVIIFKSGRVAGWKTAAAGL